MNIVGRRDTGTDAGGQNRWRVLAEDQSTGLANWSQARLETDICCAGIDAPMTESE